MSTSEWVWENLVNSIDQIIEFNVIYLSSDPTENENENDLKFK